MLSVQSSMTIKPDLCRAHHASEKHRALQYKLSSPWKLSSAESWSNPRTGRWRPFAPRCRPAWRGLILVPRDVRQDNGVR